MFGLAGTTYPVNPPHIPPEFLPRFQVQRRAYQHALRTHFPSFLRATFHTLNPSQPFIPNWHMEALHEMIAHMEATPAARFIVNMPPRSLKSLSLTVAWSAFLLGRDPSTKIITASYSSAISLKHALDVRSIVNRVFLNLL
jgi:hypothetical protein